MLLHLHALSSHIPVLRPVFLRQEVLAESAVVAGQSSLHASVVVTVAMAAIGWCRSFNQLPSSLPCFALARSWRNMSCYGCTGEGFVRKGEFHFALREGRCQEESVLVGTVPCACRVIRTKHRCELVGCSIPFEFTVRFPGRIVYHTKISSVSFFSLCDNGFSVH